MTDRYGQARQSRWDNADDDRPADDEYDLGRDDTYPASYTGPAQSYVEALLWTPGPYTGRGPRGYRRPDERIRDDVNDHLTQHGQIDASDIEVDVTRGEVMLRGSVNSRREKRMAEDVAEAVLGVNDVHNRLRVTGAPPVAERISGAGLLTRDQVYPGMNVIDWDGDPVGRVKDVRGDDFLVERPAARSVYVPFSAARLTIVNQILLNVHAGRLNEQGWPSPERVELAR